MEQEIYDRLTRGECLVLVTIVDKSGSGPRLPGSQMVVGRDGILRGSIGGGNLEHMVRQAADEVLAQGGSRLQEYDLRDGGSTGMVCGGLQLVLIERLIPAMAPMFGQALHSIKKGGLGVWVIDVSCPGTVQRHFVDRATATPWPEGIDFEAVLRRGTTQLVRDGARRLVLEPLVRRATLVLFGGGHVALAVARLAVYVDFEVMVCDNREEFITPERFPMARSRHLTRDFANLVEVVPVGRETYLVILTHGHRYDQEVLAQALRMPARYIGMIGSTRKKAAIFASLRQRGYSDTELARVHCPIGMDIGAQTPREIGVAIVAQLVAARAGVSA